MIMVVGIASPVALGSVAQASHGRRQVQGEEREQRVRVLEYKDRPRREDAPAQPSGLCAGGAEPVQTQDHAARRQGPHPRVQDRRRLLVRGADAYWRELGDTGTHMLMIEMK